ncbi:MAG: DegT/DnrJ/EryC1/StrS family aminotransferase [Deltaproteobacteria bacterium]|nr:MAG: DegT/DnrJ/EryC1/StrS family aminotransferase [Deltaproteobacteria bacterium]
MLRAWITRRSYKDLSVIEDYERKFAQICGVKHAISFGAGRMALYVILEALGIGEGDEVIIPAFTCVVVANAILYTGAKPIYVDIELQSFNIDATKIEAAITSRTKALYAQHTFGIACNVDALRDIGKRHRLPIIEDAAHALGAEYHGKPVGSLTEVAFFSSDHSKVINTYVGGMVVTNKDALALRLRKIQMGIPFMNQKSMRRLVRSFLINYICYLPSILWIGQVIHILLTHLDLLFLFKDDLKTKKEDVSEYPCRLSSLQAQIGLSQLNNLSHNLEHRRKITEYLEKKIRWNQLNLDEINQSTWLRYSFLVKDRDQFEKKFSWRFDLGVWFTTVVGGREEGFEEIGYYPGSCPVAEYVAQHIVNFPTHLKVPLGIIQKEIDYYHDWIGENILRH